MKPFTNTIAFLAFYLLLIPTGSFAQEKAEAHADSSRVKLLDAAREIIQSSNTCTLITLDQEGRPRARLMDPFPPEEGMTIWFGTKSKSRKVLQIQHDPRATIFYTAGDQSGYVMIHGDAELVDDAEMKQKYWKDAWQAFYPDKDDSYLLIRVSPAWMEVVSYAHGISGDPVTWEAQSVIFNEN